MGSRKNRIEREYEDEAVKEASDYSDDYIYGSDGNESSVSSYDDFDDEAVAKQRGKYSSSQERMMLLEYELTLMGKANTQKIQKGFFNSSSKKRNSDMAMKVLRYAFEDVLQWTPDQVLHYATEDVVKELFLGYPYSKLDLPRELVRNETHYMAGMMYPELKVLTLENLTILTYRNVLASAAGKFPKEYFSEDSSGRDRALICLRYLLKRRVQFESEQELVDTFRSEKTGEDFLKRYGLLTAKERLYRSCIEFLADAFPDITGIHFESELTRFSAALSKSGMRKAMNSFFKQKNKVQLNPFRDSFKAVISSLDRVSRTRLDRLFAESEPAAELP